MLLIANSMIVSVTSRTAEIGLRRAMGASSTDIAGLVLTEGALLGLIGDLAGSAVASAAVVAVSAASAWTVTFDPLVMAAGPVLGGLAGLASSLHPALRAARIQPALAIRAD